MSVADYQAGWSRGAVAALTLLLGEPIDGAPPYQGPLPDELRAWAEQALEKARLVGHYDKKAS